MINNKDIKTLLEFQKIAQDYSKEISRVFGSWDSMKSQIEAIAKPFYENMETIRKSMERFSKVNFLPYKNMLSDLRRMQERIESLSYPSIKLPEVSYPILSMPNLKEDERLKQLIKESIIELEQEQAEKREDEVQKLSKKRKIEGFSREGEEI